jgi:hypothetical protein
MFETLIRALIDIEHHRRAEASSASRRRPLRLALAAYQLRGM